MTAPSGAFNGVKYTGTSGVGEFAKLAAGMVNGSRAEQERQRAAAMAAALQALKERQVGQDDQRIELQRGGLDLDRANAAQRALDATENANLAHDRLNVDRGLKEVDDKRQAARDSETGRHNRAMEGVANERVDNVSPGRAGWRLVQGVDGEYKWVPPPQTEAPTPQRTGVVGVAAKAPNSEHGTVTENEASIGSIDAALALATARPESFGLKRILPDMVNQRADPEGVEARAALANIGSLQIKLRSGAAVTAKEFPRLQPFVPNVHDDGPTVTKKLQRLRQELVRINEEIAAGSPNDPRVQQRAPAHETPEATSAADYWEQLRKQGKSAEEATALTQAKFGGSQ